MAYRSIAWLMRQATTSLVPASMFRAWRTERGMRPLRTTSRRTTGSVEARMVPRSSDSTIEVTEQEVRPGGHDRDDDQGSRTQREHRDGSGALHALVTNPHAFEAEDEGQRKRSHRLQKRVLRAEHEDAQTGLPEQKSQTQKNYRKRDWGSLHEPRGETCDGEDHGDQSKGREQVGQRRLS